MPGHGIGTFVATAQVVGNVSFINILLYRLRIAVRTIIWLLFIIEYVIWSSPRLFSFIVVSA